MFHCANFLMHNDLLAMVCHRVTARVVRLLFQHSHFDLQAFRYTPLRAPSWTKKLVLYFPAMSCVGLRRGNMLLINSLVNVSEVRNLEALCLMFDLFPQRMVSSLFYWIRAICCDMPEEQLRHLDLQVSLTKGVARAGPPELTAQKSYQDLCWRMNKIFFHHSVNLVVVNCRQRMDRRTVLTWLEQQLADPDTSWLR